MAHSSERRARSSERVTTRELAGSIAALTSAVQTLVQGQQQLAEHQAALEERLITLSTGEKQVMEDLAAKLEPPEIVRARIEQEPKVTLFHGGEEPKLVAINGARWWIVPGENTVPEAIAKQYANGANDEQVAKRRREELAHLFKVGGLDTKLKVDAIIRRKD